LRLATVLFLSLLLASCDGCIYVAHSSSTILFPAQSPREIAPPAPTNGFQDIVFVITDAVPTSEGTAIVASGLYHARPVSFRAVINRHATQSSDSAVRLESLGSDSDSFIAALAEVYRAPAPRKMKTVAVFDAIPLAGASGNLGAGELKLKLFCHTQIESQYCELYLNTNLRSGIVEIAEKDPGYRQAVLTWLGQS
jgi:hypothetical protein